MTENTNASVDSNEVLTAATNEVTTTTDASVSPSVLVTAAPKQQYDVVQTSDGKFKRKAVYDFFSSVIPQTREEKVQLLNLLDSDGEALPLKKHVGESFKLVDVIFNPYDSMDEETGELINGVVSYMFASDKKVYVTSSKSVYFSLKNLFKVFGEPHYTDDEAVTVQVVEKQGKEHEYVDLKILG